MLSFEPDVDSLDFQAVFDSLPSPHMLLDRSLCYAALNAAYEAVTMRRREELLGRNIFDMFPNEGESGRRLRQSLELVLETGETDTLACIPYDIPRPADLGGGMDKRYWTAVHTPIFASDGAVSHVMQNTVDVTEMVNLRQAATLPFRSGETQLSERAREAGQQHRALLAESADFRRLFQLAPGFFAIFSGEEHLCTFANDACLRILGARNLVGRTVLEAVPESGEQGFVELMDKVYQTGEPFHGEEIRFVLQPVDGEKPKEMFLDFCCDAIRDREGRITGVFMQGMDRTEAVKAQRRQKLLLAELNHRVKNTLASVQSIVSQTLRSAQGQDQAKSDIEARLAALSNAHNLLSAREWASADLLEVIRQELSAHDRGRVKVSGPSLDLTPKASIAVAMLIHELAANAVKYGSLSQGEGTVDVAWRRDDIGHLTLKWCECGGPDVHPPDRKGFGTRLIEGIVQGELRGVYDPDYAADGFSCTVMLNQNELTDGNE